MSGVSWRQTIWDSSRIHLMDTDRYTGQPDTFVELKTSLVIRGGEDRLRFEKCVYQEKVEGD